jgi:glycosyltransferase involved in cell wall biosynthesis
MKNKPIKIVFDANPLVGKKSGVGYYIEGLVKSISDVAGDEVEIIGHYFNFLGKKHPSLPTAKNIRYVQSRLIPGKVLSLCRKIGFQLPFEVFTRTRANITMFTNFVVMPSLFRTKKVVFIYDLGFVDCPQFLVLKNLNYLKKWVPKTIKNGDLIVVNANFTKTRIAEEFSILNESLYVMPIPPVTEVSTSPSDVSRFNIPEKYLLFVGTIEPRKGILNLLEAYERLPERVRSEYSLVLAGGQGWNNAAILEKASRLKSDGLNIILTGYISDDEKATLYMNSTLCIQPSIYEGFGMPILEAMSYGKAVICSNIDVFHEVAGGAVQYFEKEDPASLKNALVQLLENPSELAKASQASTKYLASYPKWPEVSANFWNKLKELGLI